VARSASQAGGGGAVKAVGAVVFVIVMALIVLLLVRARPASEPFDPRSGQPDGARGLVLTLQDSGANVEDTREVPGVDRVTTERILVLEDRLDDEQRDAVLDFAEAGGIVVVADPDSTLHGGSDTDGGAVEVVDRSTATERRAPEQERNVAPGSCTIGALQELRGIFVPSGVLFPVGPSEPQCFTDPREGSGGAGEADGQSFVIVREFGDGSIIGLGDNDAFVNRSLRRADNAGLMVTLLVPTRDTDVAFVIGRGASPTVRDVGSGDDTLRDLVPTWAWMSLVLAAVAFVVFAMSRSAREGHIVSEPVATPIAGSELVSATGNLMQRARHSSRAGWLLLSQLHRDLCGAHGIDVNAPLADLDRTVSERSGVASGETERLLRRGVSDIDSLLDLTAAIDRMRQQVFGDRTATDHLRVGPPGRGTDGPTSHTSTDERVPTS